MNTNNRNNAFYRRLLSVSTITLWCAVGTNLAVAGYFTQPEAPFITAPNEKITTISVSGGRAEEVQSSIDAARAANSNSVLLIEVSSPIEVASSPLRLSSFMCLRFGPGSGLRSSSTATASCLLSVSNAEFVSISSQGSVPALLNGGGKTPSGISVEGSSRVNIDFLSLQGFSGAAINYVGADDVGVNRSGSVTRCRFNNCSSGLKVARSAGFVCLDNSFSHNREAALEITSMESVVAGNSFEGNGAAIISGSERGVVTHNLIGTNKLALKLSPGSSHNLICENRSTAFGQVLSIQGKENQLFRNRVNGLVSGQDIGSNNLLIANDGIESGGESNGLSVFNPPTSSHPHTNPLILPGFGRYDFTVQGGGDRTKSKPAPQIKDANGAVIPGPEGITTKPEPLDLTIVQEQLDKASTANQTNVLVLHMEGEFVSKSPNGLILPPNTCVILNGRITADPGMPLDPPWDKKAPACQVVRMSNKGYSSFSGGTLNGGRQVYYGVNAGSNAASVALIDRVNITAFARDGVFTKGRNNPGPLFIQGCTISACGGRGIWPHVCGPVHSIGNTCTANRMDGIDFDAHSEGCTALFNICNGNRRHGLFIEEAVHHHLVFGNIFNGNGQSGIHVWNQEVAGDTADNVLVANHCEGNRKGVSVGGRADDRTANGNLFFNNVCTDNLVTGIAAGQRHGINNYFSQCVSYLNQGDQIQDPDTAQAYFLNEVNPSSSVMSH